MTTTAHPIRPATARRLRRHLAVVAAVTALAVPLTATAASAQTPTRPDRTGAAADPARLEQARQRCLAEIDRRLATLDRMEQGATTAAALTDAHREAIVAIAAGERTSLGQLRPQVETAADAAALEALCRSVLTDHRIYLLRVPQGRLTVRLDRDAAAVTRLAETAAKLQEKVDERSAAGEDVTAAQAALDTMRAELDAVTDGIAGQADALLALTPGDFEADNDVVEPFRDVAEDARQDLRDAVTAAREVARALRA